jgi:diguanylate cyclase (GGDEF)-like protein
MPTKHKRVPCWTNSLVCTTSTNALRFIAGVFKKTARLSDVIGRLGNTEFAVLAPDTRAEGVTTLAKRLADAVGSGQPLREMASVRSHAGYEAIVDYHERPMEPLDMLFNATAALRKARLENDHNGNWIRQFEEETRSNT